MFQVTPGEGLKGLNDAQVAAVEDESRRLCIIAGAGSGKTKVLSERIAYRIRSNLVPAPRVLAITFTRSAARELQRRIAGSSGGETVECFTFHAFALSLLKRDSIDNAKPLPKLVESKAAHLKRAISKLSESKRTAPIDNESLYEVLRLIEWAMAKDLSPEDYLRSQEAMEHATKAFSSLNQKARQNLDHAQLAAIYDAYLLHKRRARIMDLDDLIPMATGLLETDSKSREVFQWLYREIYVDEFQDINPAQMKLLKQLVGPKSGLCVVGDPRQAIYGWNGSDPSLIFDFEKQFPGGKSLGLTKNYRSTPEILDLANRINLGRASKLGPIESTRTQGDLPKVLQFGDGEDEVEGVAQEILDLTHQGINPGSIAVLARTNSQLIDFEKRIRALEIPYSVLGGSKSNTGEEVIFAISALEEQDPEMPISRVCDEIEAITSSGPEPDSSPLAPPDHFNLRIYKLKLGALLDQSIEIKRQNQAATLKDLREEALDPESQGLSGGGVTLCSFHKAKGLEWNCVFVVGVEEGSSPHYLAETDQELQEEARLLYVAFTRARDRLTITMANTRRRGSFSVKREPSRYLSTSEFVSQSQPAGENQIGKRNSKDEAISNSRSLLDGLARSDSHLYSSLAKWRKDRARINGISEKAILSDGCLRKMAEVRPKTSADLIDLCRGYEVQAEAFSDELLELLTKSVNRS
ncbi:MAG: ATP-dependent DNA helicase UvrD2 [Acidimicrobiaceae bacterium]|nr:ATP-dependent DNA helicase UvrD2 [Acidimicrobiaceae bacterium]